MVQVPFNILRTYRHGDFYIDICLCDDFEAWLYHKDYGVKSLMFGLDIKFGLDHFIDIVQENLYHEINVYCKMYMDERSDFNAESCPTP